MEVKFYATLRDKVGRKSVELNLPEGATIQQLIAEIIQCYPALQEDFVDGQGQLRSYVQVLVNGRNTRFLEGGLDTRLAEGDRVSLFPPVGGG